MDNNVTVTSNILVEHERVFKTRHLLSVINFVAILLGTVITLILTSYRGCPSQVVTHLYILLVINIVQVSLCVVDYILKSRLGIYAKWLPYVSYAVGGLWLLTLVGEMASGAAALQVPRTDLLVVAILQCVVAVVAYLVWPRMERKAIDSMIIGNTRNDSKKKAGKSKRYAVMYVIVCVAIIFLQFVGLLAYKLPPTPYDLFAESRAVKYRETDDGTGYIAESVYTGKATVLNIPAYYNDKPVVGIAKNALVDNAILDKNKINTITIGTPVQRDGETYLESYVTYLESGAIQNDKIETLQLPDSIQRIDSGAIVSSSLKTLTYAAEADFDIGDFKCQSLERIVMSGEKVGKISSLNGMNHNVKIEVGKNIYDNFRQNNMAYINSFKPILDEEEFCVTFFTGCDYYINSIFAKKGETVQLTYRDLRNSATSAIGLDVDTKAYINNRHELGTNGAKADSAFRGWYFNSAMTDECEFSENGVIRVTENTELYAKWIVEYTGNFDWGTFTPTNAVKTLHWTDEDVVEFPVVTDRAGFDRGVVWYKKNSSDALISSNGISQSIDIVGKWILDNPEIEIEPSAIGSGINIQSKNQVEFTYDEAHSLKLEAVVKESNLSKLQYGGRRTTYIYNWRSSSGVTYPATESITLQNVAESGIYTLIVTAESPYDPSGKETSENTTNITIKIDRKDLNLGNVSVENSRVTYDGLAQKINVTGSVPSGLNVSYKYLNEDDALVASGANNVGVTNAGTYKFVSTYEKKDSSEAANYNTATLEATLIIDPSPLSFKGWKGDSNGSWSDNSIVYDGKTHTYFMEIDDIKGDDEVSLIYEHDGNKTNIATNAAQYTAVVSGLSNSNYTLDQINQSNLQKTWTILQKEVTVREWVVDDSDSWVGSTVTYDGKLHSVRAELNGAANGEAVSFTYSNEDRFVMSATNVGNYTAEIIGVSSANYTYNASASNSKSQYNWKIAPKALSVSYKNDSSLIYSGQKQGTTATISGIIPKDLSEFTLEELNLAYNNNAVITLLNSDNNDSVVIKFDGLNAGTYNVGVTSFKSPTSGIFANYSLTNTPATFAITAKTLSLGNAGITYTYNGTAQSLRVPVIGIVDSDLPAADSENNVFGWFTAQNGATSGKVIDGQFCLIRQATNAGDYSIESGSVCSNSNYTLQSSTRTITIKQRPINVTGWRVDGNAYVSTPVTYNGNPRTITAVLGNVVSGETVALTLTNNVKTDAGTYTTVATLDESYENYSFEGASKQWQISPYKLNFTWSINETSRTSGASLVYNGTNNLVTPGYTLLSTSAGIDEVQPTYGTQQDLNKTDVGSYNVQITGLSGKDAGNYELGNNPTFAWSITRKTVSANWAAATSFTYNGQYQGPSLTLTGLVGDDGGSVALSVSGSVAASPTVTSATNVYAMTGSNGFAVNAGTYSVNVTSFSNGNYELSTVGTSTQFTINRKSLRLTGDWTCTGGSDTLVYSNVEYSWSTSINTADLVKHLNEASNPTITLNYSNASAKNAGSYTTAVTSISGTRADNYVLDDANKSHSWTIQPKPLTVTWRYSTSNPAAYTAGSITNDVTNFGGKYSTDTVTISYTGNVATNAGPYTATATSTNSNYVISNETKTQQWKISSHEISSLNWTTSTYTYDGQSHHPTATYTYNGEALTFNYTGDTSVKNASATQYSVTASLTNGNYQFASGINNTKSFTINPRELDIVWTGSTDVVYDGQAHTFTANWSNLVSGETVTMNYTSTDRSQTNVGSKTVTVLTNITNTNYTVKDGAITSKTVTITPRPATLTWTLDSSTVTQATTSLTYNGSKHTLTAQIKGNDNSVVYTRSVEGTNAGRYVLNADMISPNYTLQSGALTQVTLTINPQPVAITWAGNTSVTYNGQSQSLTATVVGQNDSKNVTCSGNTVSGTNAGTYSTRISLSNSNYTLTGATGNVNVTLTINPQPVAITWAGNTSVTYNGQSQSLTATVVGQNDSKNVTCSGNTVSGTNAGTYSTRISLSNSNYTLTGATGNVNATLTINQCKVTITWSGTENVTYDGTSHSLSATVKGVGNATVACSGLNVGGTNVGSYTTYISVKDPNYTVDGVEGATKTLTITKRVVNVTWMFDGKVVSADQTITYDGKVHELSVTIGYDSTVVYTNSVYGLNAGNFELTAQISTVNYSVSGQVLKRSFTINKASLDIPTNINFTLAEGDDVELAHEKIRSALWYVASNYGVEVKYFIIPTQTAPDALIGNVTGEFSAGTYIIQFEGISGANAKNYNINVSSKQTIGTITVVAAETEE